MIIRPKPDIVKLSLSRIPTGPQLFRGHIFGSVNMEWIKSILIINNFLKFMSFLHYIQRSAQFNKCLCPSNFIDVWKYVWIGKMHIIPIESQLFNSRMPVSIGYWLPLQTLESDHFTQHFIKKKTLHFTKIEHFGKKCSTVNVESGTTRN